MVGAGVTAKFCFDLMPGDIYWCTADCGWITGAARVMRAACILRTLPFGFSAEALASSGAICQQRQASLEMLRWVRRLVESSKTANPTVLPSG